ncbi:autotransporter domain-containing protein [Xanthobacter sediminis]
MLGTVCGLAFAGPAFGQEGPGWNLYGDYATSYTIQYSRKPDLQGANAGFYVNASINGLPATSFQLDTGSQGMVVPQYLVPDFQQSGNLQKIAYGSSSNYGLGTWSVERVTFADSTDGHGNKATAEVPIFVMAKYFTAEHPKGISCAREGAACAQMIGIGFGRPDSGWGPDYLPSLNNNPLLHLAGMDDGSVRAGYVITPTNIQAGLTSANAGTGFAYVQLLPSTGPTAPNWKTPRGRIVADGVSMSSPILLDTGIRYMWADLGSAVAAQAVSCPGEPGNFRCAPPGTRVAVYFGGTDAVGYSFVVGGTDNPPATPAFARLNESGVNTGVRVIASFDYMFDAVGGFAGYKARDPQADGISFSPYLSAMGTFNLPSGFTTSLPVHMAGDAVFSAAQDALFSAAFTGSGALTLNGPGGITFQAGMTLPAGITVSGGTATFTAAVAAPLTVAAGAHVLNTGAITGAVTSAGTFSNDGAITGTFTNSGLLTGSGSISGDLITSGGLSPGHSIGTARVDGNVVFSPGSYFVAELGAGGASDLVVSGGRVRIDGATLYVTPTAAWTPGLASYRLITAASGITGGFTVVAPGFGRADATFPFLDAATTADAEGLRLDIVRSDVSYAAVAATANQAAVAQVLDSPGAALNGDIVTLSAAQARAAFDALSGELHASAKGLFVEQSSLVRNALTDRLRAAQGSVGASAAPVVSYEPAAAGALGYAAPAVAGSAPAGMPLKAAAAPATTQKVALWTSGFGNWGDMDGNANAAGLSDSTGGFLIGADAALGAGWRLGLVGGYSSTDFSAAGRNSSGQSENWHAGLYGGTTWGDLALRTGLAYTWQDVSSARSVAFTGYSGRLSGDYDAGTFQAFGELGWRVEAAFAAFEPYANLAYVHLHTDGYQEEGGAAALAAGASDMDTGFTTLGLRASKRVPIGGAATTLSGAVGWRHAFGDVTPVATQAFFGSGAFTVAGAPIAEDAAVLEAGLDVEVGPSATLGIAYAGQLGGGVTENGFNASLKVSF